MRLHPNLAAVALNDFFDNGQARSRPATIAIASMEPLKQAKDGLLMARPDANPVISHIKNGLLLTRSPLWKALPLLFCRSDEANLNRFELGFVVFQSITQ
jgi:hypothetical protein